MNFGRNWWIKCELTRYVDEICQCKTKAFVPHHHAIVEHEDQGYHWYRVHETIAADRPPIELHHLAGKQAAARGHSENVEHRWTNDRANANVAVCDKCAHRIDEQFGTRCGGRHECCTDHILVHVKCYGIRRELKCMPIENTKSL